MKNTLLGVITFLFLVILAPVFLFSMLAPWAMKPILIYWTSFVLLAGGIGGGIALWAHMETR